MAAKFVPPDPRRFPQAYDEEGKLRPEWDFSDVEKVFEEHQADKYTLQEMLRIGWEQPGRKMKFRAVPPTLYDLQLILPMIERADAVPQENAKDAVLMRAFIGSRLLYVDDGREGRPATVDEVLHNFEGIPLTLLIGEIMAGQRLKRDEEGNTSSPTGDLSSVPSHASTGGRRGKSGG